MIEFIFVLNMLKYIQYKLPVLCTICFQSIRICQKKDYSKNMYYICFFLKKTSYAVYIQSPQSVTILPDPVVRLIVSLTADLGVAS